MFCYSLLSLIITFILGWIIQISGFLTYNVFLVLELCEICCVWFLILWVFLDIIQTIQESYHQHLCNDIMYILYSLAWFSTYLEACTFILDLSMHKYKHLCNMYFNAENMWNMLFLTIHFSCFLINFWDIIECNTDHTRITYSKTTQLNSIRCSF